MTAPADYEFIGSKNSYYSAKVRACLQYKRLPYSEVCANGDTIRRAKDKTGNHMYPVVLCPDGSVLQDSCDIVDALEQRHPARPVLPYDPVLRLLATLFETIADDFMILTSIRFRWVPDDTSAWAVRMFQQICTERMPEPEQRAATRESAVRIARSIQKRVTGQMAQSPEIVAVCERQTREICDRLDAHLDNTPFLLGDRPSLADLGMMNALFGHLYRDPGEICDHIHWKCISLSLWIDHMLAAAGESDRGELFFTSSLAPVLETFGTTYGAYAATTLEVAEGEFATLEPEAEPRQFLGAHETTLAGVPATLPVSSYVAWKLQRVLDCYRAIPESDRADADRILEPAGLLSLCRTEPSWRLEKRGLMRLVKVS